MEETGLQGGFSTYAWRLGVTLLFVLLNGFFVAAEFALVKVRATKIDALVAEGNSRARVTRHILDHLNHYLSACQLGITIASLILGWLAEPAIAQLLIAGVGALGLEITVSSAVTHAIALAIALTIVTILHMTVGEQAPKIWAIHRAESTALAIAYPLRVFAAMFRPFIWFVNAVSNAMLRAAGLTTGEHGEILDIAEIKSVLASSAAAGKLSDRQLEFGVNVLDLVDIETRHILVPRVDAALLSIDKPFADNMRVVLRSGHSRFPLCDTDLDSVQGIVHAKDLLAKLSEGSEPQLEEIARPVLFVPETTPLLRLIPLMQRERSHCVVVIGEHGSALGLAFLEDALEHVVGTIGDEFDDDTPAIEDKGDGSFVMSGRTPLPEAMGRLGIADLSGGADTIGGHIVALLGKLPEEGDRATVAGHEVTVTRVSGHRIESLRFEPDSVA